MNNLVRILSWGALGIVSLIWLYVAARVVTRGVLRTIRRKERDNE